jgi:hypothetical protein
MPEPEDAVLVVSGGRIEVLDADGRVAMRVRTGAEPVPAINGPRAELMISDFFAENGRGRHRLLIFDLQTARLAAAIELEPSRVRVHDIHGQALVVSGDGRLLYWDRHDFPELGQRDSRHVWRVVDLETRQTMDWGAAIPGFGGNQVSLATYGPSAMVVHCSVAGGPYVIEAGVVPELRDAPANAPVAGWRYRAGYAGDYVLAIDGDIPAPTLRISKAITGAPLAEQQATEAVDVILIDSRRALVLKENGTLEHIDVWTGDTETLPYRLPVRRYGEVALAR